MMRRGWTILGLIGLCVVLALPAAGREPRPTPNTKTRKAQAVGKWAFERLDRAHKALEKQNYAEVLTTLEEMKRRKKLTDQERALMWQTFGYAYSAQEKYLQAVEAFENCLEAGGLDPAVEQNITYNLAQIYVILEKYKRAVELFEQWFAVTEKPSAGAHYMFAIAYMRSEQFEKAIPQAEKAIAKSSKVKETYLQMALSLYFETKKYAKAASVLERLAAHFPKKVYWTQLSAVYSELGKQKKAMTAMELAYLQGLLTKESELLNLAQLYLYNDLPYKAANVMEKALAEGAVQGDASAWQILADSWLQAREREKAMAPLRKAAELSDNGRLYVRLGQLHLGEEEWRQARAAIRKGMQKGGLRDVGQAHLLAGIAYAGERNWEGAERSFEAAKGYKSSQRMAEGWLANLEREKLLAGE